MRRLILTLTGLLLCVAYVQAQTGEISGKVVDENGEGVPFANVSALQEGSIAGGQNTDFNGFYTIKPLSPGKYDVQVSYIGYGTKLTKGVLVSSDKITTLNLNVKPEAEVIDVIEIVEYKVPLIDKEDQSTKTTISADDIKNLPTRNINAIASTSAGVYSQDEGGALNIKGARTGGTEYYVDGIRVRGSVNLPANAVQELTVITGGVSAKYGDATGGIVNITTKGPSRKLNGGVSAITSQFLDDFGYNLVNFNMTGPMWIKNKGTDSARTVAGWFVAGEYLHQDDPDPSALGVWVVNEDKLAALEASPLIASSVSDAFVDAAETLTFDDLENVAVKPNTKSDRWTGSAKLDFKVTDNINLTFGGSGDYRRYHSWVQRYTLMNSVNNPLNSDLSWRVFGRFTQRFAQTENADGEKRNAFQNFFYRVQFDYSKVKNKQEDDSHGFNPFQYGHVGKYEIFSEPIYAFGTDETSGKTGWLLAGYTDTLVKFTPGTYNPTSTAFATTFYDLAGDDPEGVYENLDQIRQNNGLLNGERTTRPHGIWFNTGRQFNGYGINADNDQFRLSVNGSVDILPPKASDRNKHAVEFGFEFEQRIDRQYFVNPLELWQLMRQLTNSHIAAFDTDNPNLLIDGVIYDFNDPNAPAFGANDTILYDRLFDAADQSVFDRRLRESLSLDPNGTELVNTDALDPSEFSLDLFSADELLNNGNPYVNYYGYDYVGNKLSAQPSFNDYFTARDGEGNFTRPIAASRPIYSAFYIQDKFNFKDLLFNVGVRVDRFDANTKVLADEFSLYQVYSTAEVRGDLDGTVPDNIDDDFVVYVDDFNKNSPIPLGYRDPDTDVWYNAEGEEIANPAAIARGSSTGQITPYLVNPSDDIKDPDFDPNTSFRDYDPQITVMPRIAFSFNLTDEASFFAHYDILAQRPQPNGRANVGRNLATPADYYFFVDNVGITLNNPNLKPEKTIDYQLGFRQLVSSNSAITISAFYRELRDMVQVVNVSGAYPRDYLTFGNIDFGTVKGFSVAYDMRRTRTSNLQLRANYTLQFADGTGSGETSQGNLVSAGQPNLRVISPLDYDSRHLINVVADYRWGEGKDYNGPKTKKGYGIFQNTGLNLIVRARSGEPYTAQANATGDAFFTSPARPILEGSLNGSRLPWNFNVDFRIDRSFNITPKKKNDDGEVIKTGRPLYLNVYLWVQNLFDFDNVLDVYPYTGNADDDGYLASPIGQQDVDARLNSDSFVDLYNAFINDPENYARPRQIRLGVEFNF